RQLHGPAAVLDHDHLAAVGRLQHDGPSAATQPRVDELPLGAPRWLHGEVDDAAAAVPPHLAHVRVIGVEHRETVAGDRFDDDPLHRGELRDGVDAAQTALVGTDG